MLRSNLPKRLLSDVKASYDPDLKLRTNIRFLGEMLGVAVRKDNEDVYQAVETLRVLAREVGCYHLMLSI